jgi:dTMP kinase
MGELVVCDRYADSTLAYQGYGHQIDLVSLKRVIEFATGSLWPDLTLLLDIEPEAGLKRRMSGGGWNRLDAYDLPFHERVRKGYLELARSEPGRWVLVDASGPVDEVQRNLRQVVLQRLEALQES